MRRYILFHNQRHPNEMAMTEIDEYLNSEVFQGPRGCPQRVVAEDALRFLYEIVLGRYWPEERGKGGDKAKRLKRGSGEPV